MGSVYQSFSCEEYTYVEPNNNEIDNKFKKVFVDCREDT